MPRSSSRAVAERGSSLFIKRVADLEEENKDEGHVKDHFKNSGGKAIEMESSPF